LYTFLKEFFMFAARISLSFVLAAALLAGCDKKENETPKTDNSRTAPSADDVKKAADAAKAKADEATKNAADAKAKADDASKAAADSTKAKADDAAKTAAEAKAKADDASKTATDATKTTTETMKANASEWMTKLQDAIKDKKLDDAKTYLDKLDGIKSNLPEEMQNKLTSLKAAYNAAKTGAAIPGGVPSLNK
jgi:hypothetical protein